MAAMDVVLALYRSTNERDENMMCTLYRALMMSDRLPSLEDVKQVVGNSIFYALYAEIWYRHPAGSSSIPTFPQRLASWYNYRCLFEVVIPILSDSRFPYQWLWDMVDEFVNQFQSFSELRAKDPTKLKEYYEDWSVHYVLLLLERLAELFPKLEVKDVAGELMRAAAAAGGGCCDSEHVSIAMGYFSKVALLRVHCLLGNYQTGLDCMRPMDITQRGFYTRHIATHITTIYHYGFANFMSGSHVEAIREFNEILKTEQQQQPQQNEQRILDKMRDLLAVCLSLCPEVQLELVDERLGYQLMKNHGENIVRMQSCDDADAKAVFKELLSHAWPRFTTSFAPSSGDPREFFSMEELEELVPEGEDEEFLAIVFPDFFGPSDPSYVSPLANYEEVQIFCSNESVWLIWLLFSKKMGHFYFKNTNTLILRNI
ncbi:putative Zinc finger, PARP-type, translation initiation factor 3 complex subunit L [Helianthus debilis subsp. tardiflorus]